MTNQLQAVRGTKDLFGEDIKRFNLVIETAKKIAENYGFNEIETPIFEFTEVFARNIGEETDIVSKEMYTFEDKGGKSLSLRPEFTAGIVRCFSNDGEMQQKLPQKFFSAGPVFRYERPQKGRYRQFHQINCEYMGVKEAMADVETMKLAYDILKAIGLKNIKLEINSLGSVESKKAFEEALIKYLTKYKNDLSEDSKIRLEKNPLRILDSKDEGDKKILQNAPKISDYYTQEDKNFFDEVLDGLNSLQIDYFINSFLVRGLDYYTSTVFEFTTTDLGAQGTVLGGGRYDNLVKEMGAGDIPAVGFGGGIERMMLLLNKEIKDNRAIAIIPVTENENDYALKTASELRDKGIYAEFFYSGKLKKKLNKANQFNCKYAVIIGEAEIETNEFKLKDLDSGEEKLVKREKLAKMFKD
jgi:histidyl-tRNA synthetase